MLQGVLMAERRVGKPANTKRIAVLLGVALLGGCAGAPDVERPPPGPVGGGPGTITHAGIQDEVTIGGGVTLSGSVGN